MNFLERNRSKWALTLWWKYQIKSAEDALCFLAKHKKFYVKKCIHYLEDVGDEYVSINGFAITYQKVSFLINKSEYKYFQRKRDDYYRNNSLISNFNKLDRYD